MVMRRREALATVLLLAAMPCALPVLAQSSTPYQNWQRCVDNNPDLAVAGCTAVIQAGGETNADLAIAFTNRSIAYRHKGENDQAILDCDQAIRLSPSYADAFNGRGIAYSNKGQYDRAIQDYDQAIRLLPSYAHAFYNRGNAYHSKGQPDRAIEDYDQAIRLNPTFGLAYCNRGIAYRDKGQHVQANRDFDEALRLNPSAGDARQTGRCR